MKTTSRARGLSFWTFIAAALLVMAFLQTGPAAGETLRFVFMGDSRNGVINTAAVQDLNSQILKLNPQPAFVFFGGDMARWGLNSDGTDNFQTFRNIMQQSLGPNIPVYYVAGNHELYQEGPNYGTTMYRANQLQYQQVFSDMPSNGPTGYQSLVYSLTSPGGSCFFAVLYPYYMNSSTSSMPDNETGTIDPTQYGWLSQQLAQPPATNATYKFLFVHVPTYKMTSNNVDSTYLALWSLIDSNKFTIYGAGHEHLYSRRTIDGTINPNAQNNVVQLICGDAGASANTDPIVKDVTSWNIYSGSYYYSVIDVTGSQVSVTSYGGSNGNYTVVDSFTIPPTKSSRTLLLLSD